MRCAILVLSSLCVMGCLEAMDERCFEQMVNFHHYNQLEALELCDFEAKAIYQHQLKSAFNHGMSQGFMDH